MSTERRYGVRISRNEGSRRTLSGPSLQPHQSSWRIRKTASQTWEQFSVCIVVYENQTDQCQTAATGMFSLILALPRWRIISLWCYTHQTTRSNAWKYLQLSMEINRSRGVKSKNRFCSRISCCYTSSVWCSKSWRGWFCDEKWRSISTFHQVSTCFWFCFSSLK